MSSITHVSNARDCRFIHAYTAMCFMCTCGLVSYEMLICVICFPLVRSGCTGTARNKIQRSSTYFFMFLCTPSRSEPQGKGAHAHTHVHKLYTYAIIHVHICVYVSDTRTHMHMYICNFAHWMWHRLAILITFV